MTNIKIINIESATSKAGKEYWRVETDCGKMSCFEKDVAEELERHIGEQLDAEVKESNGFKNIRGLMLLNVPQKTIEQSVTKVEPKCTANNNKNTTMYVSYAKDIFCAMKASEGETLKDAMKESIALVKQARDAFS